MVRRARLIGSEAEAQGDQDSSEPTATAITEQETAADASSSNSLNGGSEPHFSGGFNIVDRSKNDDPLSTIEVVEAAPRRGRPVGSTRSNRVPRATPNEIAQAAPLMVGLTNQVVVSWLGPECAMLQTEANFLTPSVARVLSRLPRGAAQQVSLYTDPFIILVALGLWGSRIARIKDAQAKQKYQTTPFEAARAYGESGTELHADDVSQSTPSESPIVQSDESKNGQAKAAAAAIMRTVSPT
jgi:hypothetical protein